MLWKSPYLVNLNETSANLRYRRHSPSGRTEVEYSAIALATAAQRPALAAHHAGSMPA